MGKLIDRKRRERAKIDRPARRTAILEAARKAMLSQSTGELTLESLDRTAGLLQGSASVCFGTLEELVFHLFREETTFWLGRLESAALSFPGTLSLNDVADLLATTVMERPLFCRLMAVLPAMADHSTVEMGQFLEIEIERLSQFRQTGAFLETRCPNLENGRGLVILRRTFFIAGALDQLVNPPSGLLLAMNDEALSSLYPDAGEELRTVLAAVVAASAHAT